jgi:peptidoglycan/xylan/chitin deacetylase (PgdA/CDA1 family)
MSWDDARQLSAMGFEIGSHTVNHPILSQTSREKIASELRDSKAVIERELQRPCTAFAYPNGQIHDVNQTVFDEVRAAGYRWCFMSNPGWQKRGGDAHRIARIGCPGHTDMATFKLWASGLHTRLAGMA